MFFLEVIILSKANLHVFYEFIVAKMYVCLSVVHIHHLESKITESCRTLTNLELSMCYVDKGKAFTVGPRNYKMMMV